MSNDGRFEYLRKISMSYNAFHHSNGDERFITFVPCLVTDYSTRSVSRNEIERLARRADKLTVFRCTTSWFLSMKYFRATALCNWKPSKTQTHCDQLKAHRLSKTISSTTQNLIMIIIITIGIDRTAEFFHQEFLSTSNVIPSMLFAVIPKKKITLTHSSTCHSYNLQGI